MGWCFLLGEQSDSMRLPARTCTGVSLGCEACSVMFLWRVGIEVECVCEVWAPGVLLMFV